MILPPFIVICFSVYCFQFKGDLLFFFLFNSSRLSQCQAFAYIYFFSLSVLPFLKHMQVQSPWHEELAAQQEAKKVRPGQDSKPESDQTVI